MKIDIFRPLSEPKKLKDRFDEIFEVSEYVEIMDNIKAQRKVLDKRVIELDNEIQNHLEGYVLRSNAVRFCFFFKLEFIPHF